MGIIEVLATLSIRTGWRLADPRTAVLAALGAIVLIGGLRRWYHGVRARRAVARLAEVNVAPATIEAVAAFGREGVTDLFRLLESAPEASQRKAAGRALATLWARDQLIAEEEKAIVTRGLEVVWAARRRYPRAIHAPIPIMVRCDVPFLRGRTGRAAVEPGMVLPRHRRRARPSRPSAPGRPARSVSGSRSSRATFPTTAPTG